MHSERVYSMEASYSVEKTIVWMMIYLIRKDKTHQLFGGFWE